MRSRTVLIPARRFEVEVVLGPHDGLTILEQTLLRAIALGAGSVESLVEALALPPPMVLEATVDLLGRGLVDARVNGALQVHQRVREAMRDPARPAKDWFIRFQSAKHPEPETVHLVQDLVAGEVFSLPRFPRIDRARLPAMPENAAVPAVDEIPLATLHAAVSQAMRAVRRMAASGATPTGDRLLTPLPRDARILHVAPKRGAQPAGGAGHVAVRGMRIEAEVVVSARGDGEPPRVVVLEPASLPAHVRRAIGAALDGLWSSDFGRGPGQFFDVVSAEARDAVGTDATPPRDGPNASLAQMDALLAEDARSPGEVHTNLIDIEVRARDAIEHLAAHAASATLLVRTAATFHDAGLSALRSAEQQVLLSCPWIGQLGRSEEWRSAIGNALVRGVNVILVWGIDEAPRVHEDPAWRALAELGAGARGRLVAAARGARSHAKLIVEDVDVAVVSSCNFMNSSRDHATREVGIRIERGPDGSVPLAIRAMLAWARRLIPDYLLRERCLDTPLLFGRTEARPLLRVDGEPVLPPQAEFSMGVDLWRGAWRTRRTELAETAAIAAQAAIPIVDAEHRDLLVHAIHTAKRRLLLESHRVSPHGLSEPIVAALIAAARGGVAVRLRYGSRDLEPLATERLDEIARAGIEVAPVDTHAKLLVCDDWAVVSSHNFLSVDPGARSAHELGVQVFAPAMVDAIWAASTGGT